MYFAGHQRLLMIEPSTMSRYWSMNVCAETDALSVALSHLGERKAEQLARLLEELAAKVADANRL